MSSIVILHGDIVIPIVVPADLSFVMDLDSYGKYKSPEEKELSAEQIASIGLVKAAGDESYVLKDYDGDAKTDAVVEPVNGLPYFVVAGGKKGVPTILLDQSYNPEDKDLKKSFEAWSAMKDALINRDYNKAVSYFTPDAGRRYSEIFNALDGKIPEIVGFFRNFKLVSAGENTSIYALNRVVNGEERLFFIALAKQHDGSWKLEAM